MTITCHYLLLTGATINSIINFSIMLLTLNNLGSNSFVIRQFASSPLWTHLYHHAITQQPINKNSTTASNIQTQVNQTWKTSLFYSDCYSFPDQNTLYISDSRAHTTPGKIAAPCGHIWPVLTNKIWQYAANILWCINRTKNFYRHVKMVLLCRRQ